MAQWVFNDDIANPITDGEPWIHPETGVKYGRNDVLLRSIPGRVDVVETDPPTGVAIDGNSIILINGVPTRIWSTSPLPSPAADSINSQLLRRLAEIDAKTIRPLRAIVAAQATGMMPDAADTSFLISIQNDADSLRAQLVQ